MSLLTDSALLGVGESANILASWKADGTLIGTITLPSNTNGKRGAVAASATDSRIYVTTGTNSIHVYDANGVLQTTITTTGTVRSLYVPEAGKFWAAVGAPANGEIREYDENGVFQSVVADLTYTGGGYIEAGYGMYKFSNFAYYIALRGPGFEINSGVFKDNLSDSAVSVQVRPMVADITGPRRFAMGPSGDFFVTDSNNVGDFKEVNRINSAGVFQQGYVVINAGTLAGLALDQDGTFFWAGDVTADLIYRVKVSDATKTSFSSIAESVDCGFALTTPFGSTPAEDLPISGTCPIIHTGTVGSSYNAQVNATGGTPPYTYAVTGGALPPGLTLDPDTGIITGTPTTAGTFSYTVTITDSA